MKPFDGDLDDYRRFLLTKTDREPSAKPDAKPRRDGAQKRKLKPLKDKAENAEREVLRLQRQIADHDAALAAPDIFARDPAKAAAITKERLAAAQALEKAEACWLEAAEEYESAPA